MATRSDVACEAIVVALAANNSLFLPLPQNFADREMVVPLHPYLV